MQAAAPGPPPHRHKRVAFLGFGPHALNTLKPLNYLRDPKTLPEILLTKRKRSGLYQYEAAELIGVTKTNYREWESGRAGPILTQWPKVIAWLGLDPLEDLTTRKSRFEAFQRRSGLSYTELAEQMDIRRDTLSIWVRERSSREPQKIGCYKALCELSLAHGIKIDTE